MESMNPAPPQVGGRTLLFVGGGLVLFLTGLVATALLGYFSAITSILCIAGALMIAAAFLPKSGRNGMLYLNSTLYTTFFLGSLFTFFLIVKGHPLTADVTKSKLFSLSEETKSFLRSRLSRNIRITCFVTERDRSAASLLLSEYARYSPYFQFQLRNPFKDDAEARRFSDNVAPGDTFCELLTTDTLTVERALRIEKLQEEQITNAIVQLLRGRDLTLYFLTGHGEPPLDENKAVAALNPRKGLNDNLAALTNQLQKSFIKCVALALDQRGAIPADASAVVCVAPTRDLTPVEAEALRSYLAKGGRFFLFLNPEIPLGGDVRPPLQRLTETVEQFGLALTPETVVMPLAQKRQRFRIPVSPSGSHPITELDQEVPLEFAQARPISKARVLPSGGLYEPLLSSPDGGWLMPNEEIARALAKGKELEVSIDPKSLGPKVVAAAVTILNPGKPLESATRIVAVGNGGFLATDVLNQSGWLFFQNAINWLTDSGDLIAIPSATIENTPLELTDGKRHLLFVILVLFVPSLVGLAGVLYGLRRRVIA